MAFRVPATLAITAFATALLVAASPAWPQTPPAPAPPDGATLFKRQCGTCHTAGAGEPNRQGPNLHGVLGRVAGKQEGFRYSPALAGSEIRWDAATLDAWLADSAKLVPGSVMPYRQANPAIRGAIIDWLKEGN